MEKLKSAALIRTASSEKFKDIRPPMSFEGTLFGQTDREEHTQDSKNWNSTIVSPFLTKLSLFPLYLASNDPTLTEMNILLNMNAQKGSVFSNQTMFSKMAQELSSEDSSVKLGIHLLISRSCETSKEYETFITKCFGVNCMKIDFGNGVELDEQKEMLLIHDIYHRIVTNSLTTAALCTSFQMASLEWNSKFLAKNTIQNYKFINVFSEDKKAALCTVDMMSRKDAKELYGVHKWPVLKNTTGSVQFYSLTLSLRPGNLRVTFILPEGASRNLYTDILDAFESSDSDIMSKIMEEAKEKTLDILLPKCTIKDEHAMDLHKLQMFQTTSLISTDKKTAFEGLTQNDAFHLTYFTQYINSMHMDESGVHGDVTLEERKQSEKQAEPESTGSTNSGSGLFSKKKTEFIMNRPFFFILSHTTDNNILLMGRVNKP